MHFSTRTAQMFNQKRSLLDGSMMRFRGRPALRSAASGLLTLAPLVALRAAYGCEPGEPLLGRPSEHSPRRAEDLWRSAPRAERERMGRMAAGLPEADPCEIWRMLATRGEVLCTPQGVA